MQEALCVLPSHAEAHYELGALFCQQERFTEGLMHYRLATHFNPMHAGAYNDMALLHKVRSFVQQGVVIVQYNPEYFLFGVWDDASHTSYV